MTAGNLLWYAVNSVVAPRAAARQLIAERDVSGMSLRLGMLGVCAVFFSSWLVNAALLAFAPQLFPPDMFLTAQNQMGVLLDALLYGLAVITIAGISVFIWKFVFRYQTPVIGAFAGAALGTLLSGVLAPLQDLGYGFTAKSSLATQMRLFASWLVVALWLPTFYYSEIFGIGVWSAFWLNLASLLMIISFFVVLMFVGLVMYFGLDGFMSGLMS